jgi:multiple sugar transport system permease protein
MTASRKAGAARIAARVALYVAVVVIALYSFFPIYWMAVSSVRVPHALFSETSLIPAAFSIESYRNLLELTDYPKQFVNSLVVALATVALTLIFSVLIGYSLTRLQFRGKTAIVVAMLFGYMFPPLMLAIPMFSMFNSIGLTDSLFALVGAHLAIALPLGVWLLWGFFKAMPFELEEAAMVDGCSRMQAFLRIVLPLSLPGILTVAIFAFLLSWGDYVFGLILIMSDDNKTLPVALASMLGSNDLRWGEIMAGATLIALPLFVLFTFLYRYFVAGLAAGALKG